MFKLVIFTEIFSAKWAFKYPPSYIVKMHHIRQKEVRKLKEGEISDASRYALTVIPNSSFTLDAKCVSQGTSAGMSREAFATVTHPGLTEITNCTLTPSDITFHKHVLPNKTTGAIKT